MWISASLEKDNHKKLDAKIDLSLLVNEIAFKLCIEREVEERFKHVIDINAAIFLVGYNLCQIKILCMR
ncbi:hypothetical protein CLAVI_000320 [Candidatus Clavichlamydia salmonicola]|uniref:hypothetical protein n=1 Tax=Candidatus Clavichlamydia salmonicola TaxID=469812 RepID=UPI001890F2B1|nr:hypothetical protein [Candidatus Clavichlamydia salmonicola]MBF5050705.1 hypothetical protein [Candidatus Clavichlamydia salmonicola]